MKIYVAGHTGLVGSSFIRKLKDHELICRTHEQLDLTRQLSTETLFDEEAPDQVYLAAAKVGGILANSTYKADFILENLLISTNVIASAYRWGVSKLLNLGSSCIYPKYAIQPLMEHQLLTGELEQTNEPYAIAKIAAIKLCRYFNEQYGTNFISVMPTNLYGPNDNFDLETSHVLPALIRKFYDAKESDEKEVVLWGTGKPYREFLFVDDLADACVFLMENYSYRDIGEFINIGCGYDHTISEVADIVREIVGYDGKIVWDTSKPDGTPRKVLDVSRMKKLGWVATTSLRDGIERTYRWFRLENK